MTPVSSRMLCLLSSSLVLEGNGATIITQKTGDGFMFLFILSVLQTGFLLCVDLDSSFTVGFFITGGLFFLRAQFSMYA